MNCHECPDYQTEECITCNHPTCTEPDGYTCPVCGGHLEGDDYTTPIHCENMECPSDVEPDSGPYYCKGIDEMSDLNNLWDLLDVPF